MQTELTEETILVAGAKGFDWVKLELASWPAKCCEDTCVSIIDELHANLPEWKFSVRHGFYIKDVENENYEAHAWLSAKRRGRAHLSDSPIIVDPTAGQFLPTCVVGIFRPEDAQTWRYVEGKYLQVARVIDGLKFGLEL